MKILQVIPYFNPKFGGPITSVYLLSKELVKRGHDVTIITSDMDYDQNYIKSLEKYNVKIIPFHSFLNYGPFNFTPSLKKWLQKNIFKFDIIHLHEFRTYQNSVVSKYAFRNNIPIILQARGSVLPFLQKQWLKQLYDFFWGYKILNRSSNIIALSSTEVRQYIKMGVQENKIEIIPNGLDLSQFSKLPLKGAFRSKYDISDNEKLILFLGRIHKIKGTDLLIYSFSRVLNEIPNVKLVIVGPDGGDLLRIKNLVTKLNLNSHVIFVGPLYGIDKISAYNDADIFVIPSIYEVFGNTILESLACGTPVIATTGCHISDVVRQAGIVVEYNQDELKEAIITLVKNEDLARKLGETGRELVFNRFNQEEIVNRIEKTYYKSICEEE